MMKGIDADYYGYRDEEDAILVPLEAEAEQQAIAQAMEEWEAKKAKGQAAKDDAMEDGEEDALYAAGIAADTAERDAEEVDIAEMDAESAHVEVPCTVHSAQPVRVALRCAAAMPAGGVAVQDTAGPVGVALLAGATVGADTCACWCAAWVHATPRHATPRGSGAHHGRYGAGAAGTQEGVADGAVREHRNDGGHGDHQGAGTEEVASWASKLPRAWPAWHQRAMLRPLCTFSITRGVCPGGGSQPSRCRAVNQGADNLSTQLRRPRAWPIGRDVE